MAEPKKSFVTHGVTPAKLALVAGLAITLVIVVVFQFGTQEQVTLKPRRSVSSRTRTPANSGQASHQRDEVGKAYATTQKRAAQWPKLAMGNILQHDPFALPPTFVPPTTTTETTPVIEQKGCDNNRRGAKVGEGGTGETSANRVIT